MRLDRFLRERGYGSRKEIQENIRKGKVSVDSEIVKDPGFRVPEGAEVCFGGQPVDKSRYICYLLNKPSGCVTARTDENHPVVMDLVPSDVPDLAPVGRLDKDTEGVLLITNDGELAHRLLSPKYHVPKKYYAECRSPFPEEAKTLLENPMIFKDFTTEGAVFEKLTDSSAYLTVTEGKFHQVKRMFLKIGCEVTYLRRESFAGLTLEGLAPGEYRKLSEEETTALRKAAGLEE